MKLTLASAILLLTGAPVFAHRLDQYLQGTIISIEKTRVNVEITLTPGVAVFPALLAEIDINSDGSISEAEQKIYVGRVLSDLSIGIDGRPLTIHLVSAQFPALDEMRGGSGEIRIELEAYLPKGGADRKFTFENHHETRIAAYQVNCLVPRDPNLRILGQNRNDSQSFYELSFAQAGAPNFSAIGKPLGAGVFLLFAWLTLFWKRPMDGRRLL